MPVGRTNRRAFIAALGGAAAWPLMPRAQQPSTPIIGCLHQGSPSSVREVPFRQGLTESGYVDGSNVHIEYRWANYHYDMLPTLMSDLLDRQVVVVAASLLPAAKAAKAATRSIPIVFVSGSDPLSSGLVSSLARPTENLTGVTFFSAPMGPKNLELVHELIPTVSVIGMFTNPRNPNTDEQAKDAQAAAQALNQRVIVLPVGGESDLDPAFAALAQQRVGALFVASDAFLFGQRNELIARAAHHSIPIISASREFPAAGGLMSYGASVADGYRLQGVYVGKILAGAKPGDLPVLQPTKFELVTNKKTANALGLEIPMSVLMRVDEVIE
jgi:putative ABC transport system substrate-binding protein